MAGDRDADLDGDANLDGDPDDDDAGEDAESAGARPDEDGTVTAVANAEPIRF